MTSTVKLEPGSTPVESNINLFFWAFVCPMPFLTAVVAYSIEHDTYHLALLTDSTNFF
jgi:hypothetical protein